MKLLDMITDHPALSLLLMVSLAWLLVALTLAVLSFIQIEWQYYIDARNANKRIQQRLNSQHDLEK